LQRESAAHTPEPDHTEFASDVSHVALSFTKLARTS
jgi:hypothetical protein